MVSGEDLINALIGLVFVYFLLQVLLELLPIVTETDLGSQVIGQMVRVTALGIFVLLVFAVVSAVAE